MDISAAIRSAIDGNAILFVGAGVSHLSYLSNGDPVPSSSQLIDLLLEQPGGTGSKHPLSRIAGSVYKEKGSDFIYDIIVKHFKVGRVDDRLARLYCLPWRRIYTTNYDNSIKISRVGRHPPSAITLDEQTSLAKLGTTVHLNGYVERISPANIGSEILLTDTSYAAARLQQTNWLSFFSRDLALSRAIIFVGYSLYDLDIERILFSQSSELAAKTFFFIAPTADEMERAVVSQYGRIIDGGVDSLFDVVATASSTYQPSRFAPALTSLREILPSNEDISGAESSAAQTLSDLLVFGVLPEQEVLAGSEVFRGQTFLVLRDQEQRARKAFLQGGARDIVITGEIASGKSATSLNMARFFISNGYRVYYAQNYNFIDTELEFIARSNEKIVLIFDGYRAFTKQIEVFSAIRKPQHRMLLTERSATHELFSPFLDRTRTFGPFHEMNLDKISKADIHRFERLVDFGGFWGERAGADELTRQKFIETTLEGSLYRLLLEIINSKKVRDSLRELLHPVNSDKDVSRLFCCAMITNYLGLDITINEWGHIFDISIVRRMQTKYAEQLRHFVHSDSSRIYVRNGLLSLHVLRTFIDNSVALDCMVSLYDLSVNYTSADGSSTKSKWNELMIDLTKFSSIEPMFSDEPTKRAHVFKYYDEIRVYGDTVSNPDYWLQVGIACTVYDDFERGQLCFDNAYAREKKRKKQNLVRIDNYYSRFQMKLAANETDPNRAFDIFARANERLEKQIFLDNNRHYPFKTGRLFSDIAARHYEKWTPEQQQSFKKSAQKLRAKAEEWKINNNTHNFDVEILLKEIGSVLRTIG